jgi:hypothetical protein
VKVDVRIATVIKLGLGLMTWLQRILNLLFNWLEKTRHRLEMGVPRNTCGNVLKDINGKHHPTSGKMEKVVLTVQANSYLLASMIYRQLIQISPMN